MNLQKGRQYAKKDFGIKQPAAMRTDHIIGGELYSFFTFDGDMSNIEEADGFVYQARHDITLVPPGVQTDLHRHVFFRRAAGEEYTYLGKSRYEQRYDNSRNKVFW